MTDMSRDPAFDVEVSYKEIADFKQLIDLVTPHSQRILDFIVGKIAPHLQNTPMCMLAVMVASLSYYKGMKVDARPEDYTEMTDDLVVILWDALGIDKKEIQ